jgi:uncharacterized membrane protein YheB (UPF0754 family)
VSAAGLLSRSVVNLVLLPLIGAVHGYATNALAVWLLFHPRLPVRLPGMPWAFQGVLPRRRADLARSVSQAVERELMSWEHVADALFTPQVRAELGAGIGRAVTERLELRLPRFLPQAVRRLAGDLLRDAVLREVDPILEELLTALRRSTPDRPSLGRLVEERLLALDVDGLERLVRRTAGRELASIVRLGLAMGLGIGLAQGAFLQVIGQ